MDIEEQRHRLRQDEAALLSELRKVRQEQRRHAKPDRRRG